MTTQCSLKTNCKWGFSATDNDTMILIEIVLPIIQFYASVKFTCTILTLFAEMCLKFLHSFDNILKNYIIFIS